jgi:hypothetical protein
MYGVVDNGFVTLNQIEVKNNDVKKAFRQFLFLFENTDDTAE